MGCSCERVRFKVFTTVKRFFKSIFRDTHNGGPVHWIHENYRCPNCHFWPEDPCCQNVPDGQSCKADSLDFKDDPDVRFPSIFSNKLYLFNYINFLDRKIVDVNLSNSSPDWMKWLCLVKSVCILTLR